MSSARITLHGDHFSEIPEENLVQVHPISLTQSDEHAIRRDSNHVPTPTLQDLYVQSFFLRTNQRIR